MELRDQNGLTEKEFIEIYKTKNYPRPYVTTDNVIFANQNGRLFLLLIQRKGHPFIGRWALPGGFLNSDETAEEGAARELMEETGVTGASMYSVGVFSKPGRDPRGWVVTLAYTAVVDMDRTKVAAGDDAGDARWFEVVRTDDTITLQNGDYTAVIDSTASDLAFDHGDIIRKALEIYDEL